MHLCNPSSLCIFNITSQQSYRRSSCYICTRAIGIKLPNRLKAIYKVWWTFTEYKYANTLVYYSEGNHQPAIWLFQRNPSVVVAACIKQPPIKAGWSCRRSTTVYSHAMCIVTPCLGSQLAHTVYLTTCAPRYEIHRPLISNQHRTRTAMLTLLHHNILLFRYNQIYAVDPSTSPSDNSLHTRDSTFK